MKNITRVLSLIIMVIVVTMPASAQRTKDDSEIGILVESYETALNENHVEDMVQLFSEDGILILQGAPTTIGTEAIRDFYISLFKNLDFNLTFKIDEIVLMSTDWAFIRTTTSGTTNILSKNTSIAGNGHELFILKKQSDGDWRIARYAGSSSR